LFPRTRGSGFRVTRLRNPYGALLKARGCFAIKTARTIPIHNRNVRDRESEDLDLALLRAIARGDREGILSLLARGTSMNGNVTKGPTPLDMAVIADRPDLARLLVASGADVNARKENGWTSLHVAAFEGRRKMIAVLVKLGADAAARADLRRFDP
jgi:ankyrin repeat protein